MVAPGTAIREGIDNIVQARTGGLLVIGEGEELAFLYSGGLKLDVDYTPALLYQLAKMDGAIVLSANATKILWANVQLMPDPTILSTETGTRHRTAEAHKFGLAPVFSPEGHARTLRAAVRAALGDGRDATAARAA